MRTPSSRRLRVSGRRPASRRLPALFLTAVAASAGGLAASPLAAHAAELAVTIDEIRSTDGALMVSVVRGEDGFDGTNEPVTRMKVLPTVPSARFTLELPPGAYGIRMFHDLDGDGALNANLIGIPSEPWAFSNNATGAFGPPGWAKVRFEVGDEPVAQAIRLNH